MIRIVQEIFRAVNLVSQTARFSGFAISTAMSMSELTAFLKSGNLQMNEFDALICSSGSEVYYPGIYSEHGNLCPGRDYATHIDYRWGCDGLKKTIRKLMNTHEGGSPHSSSPIEEDTKSSNSHCVSYLINDISKVPFCLLEIKQLISETNETGDTDYEELISETHKTLIMKGVVEKGSEELLRIKDDIVPEGSPLVTYTNAEAKADEIATALKHFSKSSQGM
ncbi:hypothetical protein Vadar_033981 [Vaccinium darrowii]|uniref:Uncharacterized protein n=1 Tax=Vaccinium darrowii TaxID=229202 RepID=A0ACB7Y3L8_9ERIC|nr:hypothetical protein Vadar_033981 [Vaccinium darrowii]